MAGIGNDYIQQQLLDQSVAVNDNLSAMRDVLLDIKKNTKVPNGPGGNGPGNGSGSGGRNGGDPGGSGSSGGAFKNAFKDLFGEAQNIGKTMLGNNGSIQNTVGSFTAGAKVLQSSLGKLPGPIGFVASGFMQLVQVGGQLYEYMNQQLTMYNELNSAGLTLSDGMLTVRKGSSGAFMSINDFSSALKRNSTELAAMEGQYGDGVQHFGNLLNTVQLAQDKMGLYGVSQQQLADITAKNYKFEKMYSGEQSLRNMSESQSTEKFVGTMTYLSKTVGKSVDDLLKSFDSMSDTVDSEVTEQALKSRFGFSDDKAAQVNKTFNSIYASMGKSGDQLQKLMSSKNFEFSLPEEFNNNFTQLYTDQIQQLQAAGVTDEREARKRMSQWVKEHQGLLDTEIGNQQLLHNNAAAAWLKQLKTQEQMLNDPKNNPTPYFEDMTNRFNNWIGKTFTQPFNDFYIKTQEDLAKYLTDLADRSNGTWDFIANLTSDAYTKLTTGISNVFSVLAELPNRMMQSFFGDKWSSVADSFAKLGNDILDIPKKIGTLIWQLFNGSDKEIQEASGSVKSSIQSFFVSFVSVFSNMSKLKINVDDVKAKYLDAFNAMKNKLSGMWDRLKNIWGGGSENPDVDSEKPKPGPANPATPPLASQPTQSGNQTVTAKTDVTKPEKVEQADQTTPEQQVQTAANNNDQANKTLAEILNSLQAQSQNTNQTALILRQIAENTEPPRNV